MGLCASKQVENGATAEDDASRDINSKLEQMQREEQAVTKMLVLGTGESGKSTVFKQMKLLYSVPDPPAKFVTVVRANLFGNTHAVAAGMQKLGIDFQTDEGRMASDLLLKLPADGNIEMDAMYPAAFDAMWADPGVQAAIARSSEFQLNDSTAYFWERAGDILRTDFVPTQQDVLRARVRTTGIVQQNLAINGRRYSMFDVGGQRNERRKWIHVFDNVTAIIFVTAVSEFDQVLYEDESTNRIDEALQLFQQILAHRSFHNTSIILFLNKRDIFQKKLERGVPLTVWDKEYTGGADYHSAIDHVKARFLALNDRPEQRQIYAHATCATDSDNMEFVMASVFDIILKENLRKMDEGTADALETGGGGVSAVKSPAPYAEDTVILAACFFTDSLSERMVLTDARDAARLPAVELQRGRISDAEWRWCMALGKGVPPSTQMQTSHSEIGSFAGNFKDGVRALRKLLAMPDGAELGWLYDKPIYLEHSRLTVLLCVRKLPEEVRAYFPPGAMKHPVSWRELIRGV